jgi:SAM-dependent methyltransferase
MDSSGHSEIASGTRQEPRWRRLAKSVPPLYWLGGVWNFLRFRAALRASRRAYDRQGQHRYPPPMLRYRVHRSLEETSYARAGRVIAEAVVGQLCARGISLQDRDVLDFGCGPGRVVTDFCRLAPGARLVGSDIDHEAIDWARANLGHLATFRVNGILPPTDFPDGSFDVIYSISLFTHLDESAQDEWLTELSRLLRPGGVLLTTTHGRFAMGSCTPEERDKLLRQGIAFRVDHKGRFKLDGLPDFYQTTFHTREYIERHWTRFLELLAYHEGGIGNHQDIVLLRKPPTK